MAIYKAEPPEIANAAATNRLLSLDKAHGRLGDAEAGGGLHADPTNCLPVYHADAAVLSETASSLSNAQRVGWQYLVGSVGTMKSVEVIGDKAVAVGSGKTAEHISRALEIAEQRLPEQEYQARMLTFGRAENPVLWLHPDDGDDERFFTIDSEPQEVAPAEVLGRAQYVQGVRQDRLLTPRRPPDDESGG